jgi:virulence activator alpha
VEKLSANNCVEQRQGNQSSRTGLHPRSLIAIEMFSSAFVCSGRRINTGAAQRRFLATARTKIRSQMKMVEKDCAQKVNDRYPYLVARGALKILRARLEWIDEGIAKLKTD